MTQSYENKKNLHYLHVPFNFVHRFQDREDGGLFFNFGTYASYLMGGTYDNEETLKTSTIIGNTESTRQFTGKLETGNEANDDILQYDLGVQLGLGYELKNGLYFRAEYARGLVNISPDKIIDPIMYNNTIAISIGIMIGDK